MGVGQLLRRSILYAISVLSCLYLISGGFLRKKHRSLIHTICNHFGFDRHLRRRPKALVPAISVAEVIKRTTTVALTELEESNGNISTLELIVVASLVRETNPALSFEIGTYDGRTTLNIALNQRPGTEVITLDLPKDELQNVAKLMERGDRKYILNNTCGSRFANRLTEVLVTQLYGDSSKYNFSQFTSKVDLMFVDGSHSYEFVRNDSQVALNLVRKGGTIIWHDYDTPHWYGLTRALNEFYMNDPNYQDIKHVAGTSLCVLRK